MKQKVSQATIDKIKKMGMTKALKGASNANPEMKEALKRMYGQRRLDAATKTKSSVPAQKSTPEKGTGFKRVSPYPYSGVKVKSSTRPSGAPSAVSGKKVSTTSAKKPTPKPQTTWKNRGTDPVSRAIFGAARAITSGQGAQGMTAAQVAAENKRRAAKANKNK